MNNFAVLFQGQLLIRFSPTLCYSENPDEGLLALLRHLTHLKQSERAKTLHEI